MNLFIKNMVCNRCISAVEKIFADLQMEIISISLGEVATKNDYDHSKVQELNARLAEIGLQILEDSSRKQIEKMKNLIISKINDLDLPEDFILSKFLSAKLHKDYSALSKSFSQNENITLEHYFILQKIEKVKELLLYDEFSLTEISGKLGYKSVQHLSAQFRNSAGFTPSAFKKLKEKNRISLDQI